MAIAATLMQQLAQSDVMPHELAIQAGCSVDIIDNLLTAGSGGLTLDIVESIAEKLNMVLILQLRPIATPTGAQTKP
jgi:hypothetical protein